MPFCLRLIIFARRAEIDYDWNDTNKYNADCYL